MSIIRNTTTAVMEMNDLAHSRPVVAGVVGMIAGFGTWLLEAVHVAGSVAGDVGKVAGAVAAIYTALIVIRNYHGKKKPGHK
jgi:multisubunit Na+/H+ antiporter MnhB subunit